jgi:polar amino acid transport system substrate-binding protein
MIMKRWSLIAGLLASAALTGCAAMSGTSSASSPSPVIDRIVKSGELRVGTSGTQPPLSATAKDGSLMGFDIEIANAMAKAMGVKLTLVPMDFADLLSAVQKGDVDMGLSGLTMTPQRNMKVAFVGPYLVSGMSLLTKSKTMAKMRKAEEINTANVKVAALKGSTAEKFAQTTLPKAQMTLVDTLDDGVALVRQGKVDALIAEQHDLTEYNTRVIEASKKSTDPLL